MVEISEILELDKKDLIIIEKGKAYNYWKYQDNDFFNNFIKNYNKEYYIIGDKEVIVNLDYNTIQPFVVWLLNNITESKELQAIKFNRIFEFISIFFIFIILILAFMIKSVENENNKLLRVILNKENIQKKQEVKQEKESWIKIDWFFKQPETPNTHGGGANTSF